MVDPNAKPIPKKAAIVDEAISFSLLCTDLKRMIFVKCGNHDIEIESDSLRCPDHCNIGKISIGKCEHTHQYDKNVIGMYEHRQSMPRIGIAQQQCWQKCHTHYSQYGDDMGFIVRLK